MSTETCGACDREFCDEKQSLECIGPCAARYHLSCAKIGSLEREFFIVDGVSTFKCHTCTRRGKNDVCVTPIPNRWIDKIESISLSRPIQNEKGVKNFESVIVNQFDMLKENSSSALLLVRELTAQIKEISYELNLLKSETASLKCLLSDYVNKKEPRKTVFKPHDEFMLTKSVQCSPENVTSEAQNTLFKSLSDEKLSLKIVHKNITVRHNISALSKDNLSDNESAKKILKIEAQFESGVVAVAPKSEMKALSENSFSSQIKTDEELLKKMTVSKSFPWKLASFFLLVTIAGLLSYDINKHGSFRSSSTGRFLNDIGALQYGEHAWARTKFYSNKSFRWAEANVPYYYKVVGEHMKPYLDLGWDVCLVVGHQLYHMYQNIYLYVEEKTPLVMEWINYYAPGLLDKMKLHSIEAWQVVKQNALLLWQYFLEYLFLGIEWVKTNVFVGNLSPENLQKYSMEALNTTQVYAVWTYDWVCQKVQTLSKIQ